MRIAFNPSTVAALTTPPNNKDITFDLRGHNIFARGVKFCGTDTNTWRDIKINNVSIGSNTLDLRNGSNTILTNTNGVVTINSTWRPVVDNLTSDSTTSSLSANLGRILAGLINGKSDSGHTHDDRYVKKSGDTMLSALNFANGTWNKVGDDVYMGDHNIGGQLCIMGANGTTGLSFHKYGDASIRKSITFDGNTLYMNGSCDYATLSNLTNLLAINTVPNKTTATSIGSWSPISGRYVFHQKWTDTSTGSDSADFGIYLDGNLTANMVLDGYYNSLLGFRVIGATGGFLKANGTIDNSTYLTSHLSLSNYYTKSEVDTKLNSKLNYRLFWERTNIDLNSITEAWHTYEVNNGTGTANTPTNASWHLAVLWGTGDTDYAVLLCTAYTSNYSLYLRHKIAGKWYDWIQLATTTDIPTSLKNPYALTISLNGTSQGPYDGSTAKNINITPSSIGAATSGHNHDGRYVRYYTVTTLDCNNLAVGLTVARVSATNAAHTNHSAFLYISDVGTPFQIQIPDSSVPYIYKRYYSSGTWSGWFKLNAGYADSAGSVAWNNITGKPSSYIPSSHTHSWTSITDKIVAGNEFNIVNSGFNGDMWFNYVPINDRGSTATVLSYIFGNGNKGLATLNASGFIKSNSNNNYVLLGGGDHKLESALSVANADTVDGEHATNFSYTHQTSFDFINGKSGRIVTFDQSGTDYGWINGFASTHNNYLTSVIFNTHRTSNWYVGYIEAGVTRGLTAVKQLAFLDSKVADSDKLDGIHANGLLTALSNTNNGISITVGGTTKSISNINVNGANTILGISPQIAAATEHNSIFVSSPGYSTNKPVKMLCFDWYGNYWALSNIRSGDTPSAGFGVFFKNTEIARFTSDGNLSCNVASATKLQTPRSIWGQSFDGTRNVNGLLTHIISSDDLFLNVHDNRTSSGYLAIRYFRNGADVAALHWFHDKFGGCDWNSNCLNLDPYRGGYVTLGRWDNPDLTVVREGNIGIGTTSPAMKLHVNGDGIYLNSTATCGINMYSSHGESSISYKSNGGIRTVFGTYTNRTFLWNESIGEHVSILSSNGYFGIGTTTPSYKLDVNGLMRASGFHHSSMDSNNYMLLAGGGYKSFGGDDSTPIFLGYLNLDHGNDGTVSSSFYCLGYSVPFTYTRGGNYCRISIPDTTHQVFYIRAAIASVHYSGGGMDTWVGDHRSAGAWWLHCYALSANEVRVKGFRNANGNNDSWWGGNPLYSGNDGANKITVCIFGYVTFR